MCDIIAIFGKREKARLYITVNLNVSSWLFIRIDMHLVENGIMHCVFLAAFFLFGSEQDSHSKYFLQDNWLFGSFKKT